MRTHAIFGLAALLAGCTQGGVADEAGSEEPSSTEAVGQVREKAQFADDTVINVVDPGSFPSPPSLTVTADFNPVTVNVIYVNGKTTNSGSTPVTTDLVQTIELAGDQTVQHAIDMSHPAMQGGYGTIVLDSPGGGPFDVFQTYVRYSGSMFSVGGSVFTGGSYRIPYTSGSFRMVLAITNQSEFDFNVELMKVGTASFKSILVPSFSTYKFDTLAEGWSLSGTNSVQVFTTNGGVIALSGYIDRLLQRVRITPVKAAPFF